MILQEKIDGLLEKYPLKELQQAYDELSANYREQQVSKKKRTFLQRPIHRMAYLASRFPATYAAIGAAGKHLPSFDYKSFLDLGAGPGTAYFALQSILGTIQNAVLVEKDADMISLGKSLGAGSYQPGNLNDFVPCGTYDLISLAYALDELEEKEQVNLLNRIWDSCNAALIIVESGTMHGFHAIRRARELLIQKGAYIAAPCPNLKPCPIPTNDWCHFSTRFERTSRHRFIKGGTLGYEDEKFSYVIATKSPTKTVTSRIIRHPERHSGHGTFTVCTDGIIKKQTISKKLGELYRLSKDLNWGDGFNEPYGTN